MNKTLLALGICLISCNSINVVHPSNKMVSYKVIQSPKKETFITHCTITTYNAVQSQCDDTPDVTADGTKIDFKKLKKGKLRIVAVSRDLRCYLPYGSTIEIEGLGRFVVRDTMHPRFKHHIDILQDVSEKNFKLEKVKVTLI